MKHIRFSSPHSRAFIRALCLDLHSLYFATVSTDQSKTALPCPDFNSLRFGQDCFRFAGMSGFNKTAEF